MPFVPIQILLFVLVLAAVGFVCLVNVLFDECCRGYHPRR